MPKGIVKNGYKEEEPMPKSHICLHADDVPEVAGWKVGKTYDLAVKVKLVSKSEGKDGVSSSFDVVGEKEPSSAKDEE